MKKLIELSSEEARKHFLKGSSYFNGDMPNYISFEPILKDVGTVLRNDSFTAFKLSNPSDLPGVNYNFLSNKDGKFAWRPLELIHPAIYISLVNKICEPENWNYIRKRFSEFEEGAIDCCSAPVMSLDSQTDVATQIISWWQQIEQRSLIYSLEFSHILHTDVADCYGSLYTHSITWALHGLEESKNNKGNESLIGDIIDSYIRAGRYGQTNGISQGAVLMDFVAEIILGYVDEQINSEITPSNDYCILRYRDDYRIFANSDDKAEQILKVISEKLRLVGMKLGIPKTQLSRNVVEGAIKPDKLAGIELQDLGSTNAKTIQKQLLRLHSFGQRFPNSGALRRLVSEFHTKITKHRELPEDLEVQVAITADIGLVSPATFPVVAGILSHLISLASSKEDKYRLWKKVRKKMERVPYNGYLEIWLQRVTQPRTIDLPFISNEPICQIVNGETPKLWENEWISSNELKDALKVSKIIVGSVSDAEEVIQPEEVELFRQNAWVY
jgi:RNA-directed DNA polymerase